MFLIEKKKQLIFATNEKLEQRKFTAEEFDHCWAGIIVAVERNSQGTVINSGYYKFAPIVIISVVGLVCVAVSKNIHALLYGLISIIGLFISYLIFKESLGMHSSVVAKVCESLSKGNGCERVLNDKTGKLFGYVSLGDLAMLYFTTSIVSLATIGFNFTFLFSCSALSLPVVLYGLYTQGFVLKQWCALCMGISAVLILQFSILSNFDGVYQLDWIFGIKYIFILLLITSVLYMIKIAMAEKNELATITTDFMKFKRNKQIFDILLNKNEIINPNLISDNHSIRFGADDPKIIINAITNPLCGFCSASFSVYYKLLKSHNNSIQVNFIFNVPITYMENAAARISASVINIYLNQNKNKALESLRDWYDDRQKDHWEEKYKAPEPTDAAIMDVLAAHQNWVKVNQIDHTPSTIINGRIFPKAYEIEDLSLFIDDMVNEKKVFYAV